MRELVWNDNQPKKITTKVKKMSENDNQQGKKQRQKGNGGLAWLRTHAEVTVPRVARWENCRLSLYREAVAGEKEHKPLCLYK